MQRLTSSEDAVARRRELLASLERRIRRGPLREDAFAGSALHDRRTAGILGITLGIAFLVCMLTGWFSHLAQQPPDWSWWSMPARPAGLYRVTQGLHVITGIGAIPLLLAHLWVAYPRLFTWPPVRSPAHALERLALVPLVAGALFLLVTGVMNIAHWYTWGFGFIQGHYAAAWITFGALIVHVGAKLPTALAGIREDPGDSTLTDEQGNLTRRGLLAGTAGAAALLVTVTIGEMVTALRRLALLAPYDPGIDSQGLPVNRTAAQAGVEATATSPDWRLVVDGAVERTLELSREDLQAMPQREAALPIACVEGWSETARWRGVPLADLLERAGAPPGASVAIRSIEERGPGARSFLNAAHAHDRDTLLALRINGETLNLDHGFPTRLIAPNKPGVLQTKWVGRLTVQRPDGGAGT